MLVNYAPNGGLLLNGAAVHSADLHPGDILQIGSVIFEVEVSANGEGPAAAHANLESKSVDSAVLVDRGNPESVDPAVAMPPDTPGAPDRT